MAAKAENTKTFLFLFFYCVSVSTSPLHIQRLEFSSVRKVPSIQNYNSSTIVIVGTILNLYNRFSSTQLVT